MKTILSSSTVLNLAPTSTLPKNNSTAFGSGFRAFLESSEVFAETTTDCRPAGIVQPTQFLGSVEMMDSADIAWQSFTDTVRERLCNSLGNALLLAMQPTRQASGLSVAVAARRAA